ncbi:hypothetical protein CJ260_11840 [Megasphaera sp. ASD88]|uniref:nucleotidyltransferase family protein n=1 Tax=Megasphaera sp. ASD88 TaxID=2027407 RepID=UPI000BAB2AD3|nr:nucleotidyltransferase domain-containing protein [Megasphaera sp. ASD88]PAV37955.1 hypothetical protein CJ260_11840 [Megasphaera sp. ASD88]
MTIDAIQAAVLDVVKEYPAITKVTLFGSRASGNNREDSDIDLLIEFITDSISLITLSSIRYALEDRLSLPVDVIHGPLRSDDMLEVEKEVVLYTAAA